MGGNLNKINLAISELLAVYSPELELCGTEISPLLSSFKLHSKRGYVIDIGRLVGAAQDVFSLWFSNVQVTAAQKGERLVTLWVRSIYSAPEAVYTHPGVFIATVYNNIKRIVGDNFVGFDHVRPYAFEIVLSKDIEVKTISELSDWLLKLPSVERAPISLGAGRLAKVRVFLSKPPAGVLVCS